MRTLEQLGRLSSPADFFRFFAIDFDPAVLERVHGAILRSFALEVAEIERRRPMPSEQERLERYGAALRRAYALHARVPRAVERGLRVIEGGLSRGATSSR